MVWPLPPMDDIIYKVACSPGRSKIDLVQSFDQIRVDPSDVAKQRSERIAATTSTSRCKWATRMRPRRSNSFSIQYLTRSCHYVVNYLYDIMPVNTRTSSEHFLALCEIFDILRAQKLFVNRMKTKLYIPYKEPLNILGVDIQNDQITPEIAKIEAFNALPSPVFPGARKSPRFVHLALGTYPGISGTCGAPASIATP